MRITQLVMEKIACFDRLTIDFQEGRDPKKADIHLIVGANGTGKSTVLMALAQFFSVSKPTGLRERFVDGDGWVTLKTSEQEVGITLKSSTPISFRLKETNRTHPSNGFFYRMANDALLVYDSNCQMSQEKLRTADRKFSFAAFTYSGLRSAEKFKLTAIQDSNKNPLSNALMFNNPSASEELIQWIANTKAKEAFARNRGDAEKADQRREAVERIERIISNIIEQKFCFVLNEDPLEVLVEVDGQQLDMDLLPDGLKSILSWVADLLMRLDSAPWEDDVPVLERPFFLFLDEIEVHLHPAWQRKVLPAVQDLFPNAQVFVSTHSPFVIASADDAWIYPLIREGQTSTIHQPVPSMRGSSYATILKDALGMDATFSTQVEELFEKFYQARDNALRGDPSALTEMKMLRDKLSSYGEEVMAIVIPEMRQTERRLASGQTGKSR